MGAEDSCGMLGAARTKERRRFFSPSRWGHSVPGEGEEERRWLYRGRETWNLCPGSRGKWVLEVLGVGGRTHDKA